MPLLANRRLKWGDGYIEVDQVVPEDAPGRRYDMMLAHGLVRREVGAPARREAAAADGEASKAIPAAGTLEKMSKAELVELGAAFGLELSESALKKELLLAFEDAR